MILQGLIGKIELFAEVARVELRGVVGRWAVALLIRASTNFKFASSDEIKASHE